MKKLEIERIEVLSGPEYTVLSWKCPVCGFENMWIEVPLDQESIEDECAACGSKVRLYLKEVSD